MPDNLIRLCALVALALTPGAKGLAAQPNMVLIVCDDSSLPPSKMEWWRACT